MANTYINILVHAVFTTKNRDPWFSSSLRERLYPYICGIARENGLKVLCIGGTDNHNHIHILLSLNSTTSIAKAIQLIKGGSSKWIHETFPEQKLFVTVQPTAKTQRTQRKKLKEGVSSPIKSQCFQKFSAFTF